MRTAANRHLRDEHRRVIAALRKRGSTQAQIAEAIGFSQGAVSKELRRNASGPDGYDARGADELARQLKLAKRPRRRVLRGRLLEEVERLLRLDHSPEQICGAMRRVGFGPSHQTIYRHVEADRRAGGGLRSHLRISSRRRKRRRRPSPKGRIGGRVGIEHRPAAVRTRSRYGDWEADLIGSWASRGFLLSLLERKSRIALLEPLASKSSGEVAEAIARRLAPYRVRTITYDNGMEFACHLEVERSLGCRSYFCAPYRSWEKGAVENCNGLARQCFPKGSSLRVHDYPQGYAAEVESRIMQRPRKTLGFKAPSDYLSKIAKPRRPQKADIP
ncbi:IS30 family transposase [Pelagicoccus sp. SDUM812003]|uniref:IS30 family transposase n=1 Tax=Pelagicoccus sp. SDUM812003 TaxID=3041267 RepID=UPI00280D58F5|nr:IS30 family transposase [Pelagicoccus sp. SDUM812003]MDQ8205856.1 IS30 family transposase [Pelagicoccus sp. SDUM812003]